jgi:hypothetical protein
MIYLLELGTVPKMYSKCDSIYIHIHILLKQEKNISWFIVENKEDFLLYLRLA